MAKAATATGLSGVPRLKQGELTIIDACPGAGKTTTIIESLVWAANDWSLPPEQMLVLTFSKAMAAELKERCVDRGLTGVIASTSHAFCLGLIQEDPQQFGFTSQCEVLGQREDRFLQKEYKRRFPSRSPIPSRLLIEAFGVEYKRGIKVRDFLRAKQIGEKRINQVIAFLNHHLMEKMQTNRIGFDDMVPLVLRAMNTDTAYRRRLRAKYKFLAVDEYQDMNAMEREFVQVLADYIDTVVIVGDDLQVVHGYRGAAINALAELKEQFDDARVISLDQSHRLTVENASFANKVLAHNGHAKRIKGKGHGPAPQVIAANSRNDMYQDAAQTIAKLLAEGNQPEDIAVLARFNRSVETFGRYLKETPFKLTAQGDRRHKALLRFQRFLSAVVQEDGDKALQILLAKEALLDEDTVAEITDVNSRISAERLGLSAEQHKKVRKIRDAVREVRATPTIDRALSIFASAIQGRQDRFNLTPIQHVLRIEGVKFGPNTTLDELLVRVDRKVSQRETKAKANTHPAQGVTLTTTHSGKGREWKHVLILDVYDENITRNGELVFDDEAEFRVFYVAITRAKRQTHLYVLKHEAAVDALFLHHKEKTVVPNIEAINKHRYTMLRFMPPQTGKVCHD